MNELETALRETAGRLTPAVAAPPEELWAHGRRRVRRRRLAGAGVVAAMVAVVALVGPSLPGRPDAREAPPMAPTGELRLPDRFYDPSGWLKASDEPPGRLVAVVGASRERVTGSEMVLVGVSATTGKYSLLDLEGYETADDTADNPVALSPEGRYVAWWKHEGNKGKVRSLAVYDTVTGEVVEQVPRDEHRHGVMGGDIAWSDGHVWFSYTALLEEPTENELSGTVLGPFVWTPGVAGPLGDLSGKDVSIGPATPDGKDLLVSTEDGLRRIRPDGTTADAPVAGERLDVSAVAGPDGQVASLRSLVRNGTVVSDGSMQQLLVAGAGTGSRVSFPPVSFRAVAGVKANAVLGWRDANHVVVQRWRGEPKGYVTVDVRDGSMTQLSRPGPVNYAPGTVIAADAWQAPVYDAPEPDRGLDPRWWAGLGVLALIAMVLVWRRRRVRP